MNLCQGDFQLKKSANRLKLWYSAAAGLFALWLITLLSVNTYALYKDNREIAQLDQRIETIYRRFFPEAKQVINPRFRITQYLKGNSQSGDEGLWLLLGKSTQIIHQNLVTINQLDWHNHLLLVTLQTQNFITLDKLQNNLKAAAIHVKQTEASTKNKRVVSKLELTL